MLTVGNLNNARFLLLAKSNFAQCIFIFVPQNELCRTKPLKVQAVPYSDLEWSIFIRTMDIHLNLERKLSEYFGNPAIIYADYVGCPASVITAFAKRGDLLLMYVIIN